MPLLAKLGFDVLPRDELCAVAIFTRLGDPLEYSPVPLMLLFALVCICFVDSRTSEVVPFGERDFAIVVDGVPVFY